MISLESYYFWRYGSSLKKLMLVILWLFKYIYVYVYGQSVDNSCFVLWELISTTQINRRSWYGKVTARVVRVGSKNSFKKTFIK